MFGIPDLNIVAAYSLCILSALACTIYGLYNWNKGEEDEFEQIEEDAKCELGKR